MTPPLCRTGVLMLTNITKIENTVLRVSVTKKVTFYDVLRKAIEKGTAYIIYKVLKNRINSKIDLNAETRLK